MAIKSNISNSSELTTNTGPIDAEAQDTDVPAIVKEAPIVKEISLEDILDPDSEGQKSKQLRRYVDDEKQKTLVKSIQELGIMNNLLLIQVEYNKYELIGGYRRYKAAKTLDLKTVPAKIYSNLEPEKSNLIALLDNLEREDLNPFEETEGILKVLSSHIVKDLNGTISTLRNMTNKIKKGGELEDEVHIKIETFFNEKLPMKWNSFTQNRLPILSFPDDLIKALQEGLFDYSKAKAIYTSLKNDKKLIQKMVTFLSLEGSKNISVRNLRKLMKALLTINDITKKYEIIDSAINGKLSLQDFHKSIIKENKPQESLNPIEESEPGIHIQQKKTPEESFDLLFENISKLRQNINKQQLDSNNQKQIDSYLEKIEKLLRSNLNESVNSNDSPVDLISEENLGEEPNPSDQESEEE